MGVDWANGNEKKVLNAALQSQPIAQLPPVQQDQIFSHLLGFEMKFVQ